jgi:capsular polysaccharide biosynthesis protein
MLLQQGRFERGTNTMTVMELFKLMRQKIKLVILLPVICALVVGIVSVIMLPNQYTSTASVYVLSSSNSDSSSASSTYNDLSAGQMLANDIATLAKSSTVQSKTANSLHMDSLAGYRIDVKAGTTTRVITISVTGSKPEATAAVANQLVDELSGVAQGVMGVESVNVIDGAVASSSPSGPPRLMYTGIAFLIGLFIAVLIIVIADMSNTRIRKPEDAEKLLGIPVIASIPVIKM